MAASQAVYHSLRAPSDPPRVGGPPKIQIALTAWEDKSLYMPNKGEVIVEWVLNKLLKEKANPPATNPVLDSRFWALLSDIVAEQTKSVKHWLLPLLNRVPIAPIFIAFLQLLGTTEAEKHAPLTDAVNQTFYSIWPLAVHKINAETLFECFGAFLAVLEEDSEGQDALEKIGDSIISSLRVAVGNSSNKRKLSSLFIQNHLRKWLASSSGHTSAAVQESVYLVGIETLFNVETLRQVHDADHPLFVALQNISNDLVHPILPRLFSSFVQCTKKYRSTLFGQSSAQNPAAMAEHVCSASFSFFDACQILLNTTERVVSTWEATLGLLTVVGDENLFTSSQLDGQVALQSIVPLVLAVLGSDRNGNDAEQVSLSMRSLSKLMQIDHDLILKDIPRILPKLLCISASLPSIFDFLDLLLDYHVKTRTLHTHVETLFAALAPRSLNPASTDLQHEYRCCSSSAFMHSMHLERLAKFMRKFLTPNQTGETMEFVFEQLQASWDQTVVAADSTIGNLAATFSVSARLASVILTSLPLHSLPETTLKEVHSRIGAIRDTFLPRAITKTFKVIRKNVAESWGSQVIAAALLRLAYALDTPYSEKLWKKIAKASEDEQLLPELSLEHFRILIKWSAVSDPGSTQELLDGLLNYLEGHSGSSQASWSGTSCSLTFGSQGRGECVLAILQMLIERWLPTIDVIASVPQLQRLVKILMRSDLGQHVAEAAHLNASSLLLSALSSAQFWELPNVRTAILSFTDETTSVLADPDSILTVDDCASIFSTYQLLLMFPIEYISRTMRTELVKRAVNLDVFYNSLTVAKDVYPAVTVVRVFIHNVALYLGSMDQPILNLARYLNHLIQPSLSSDVPQNYTAVTWSLVELHFSALLKSSEPGSVQATSDVLRSCLPSDPNVLSSTDESKVLVRVIGLLTTGFSPSNLPNEVQNEIHSLHQRVSAILVGPIEKLDVLFANKAVLNLWLHTLCLGRWLKLTRDGMPFIGPKLCSWASKPSVVQPDRLDVNRTTAFAILAEELRWMIDDRLSQLDFILATYLALSRLNSPNGQVQLDQLLSQTCSALSVTEFCHVLSLARECLSDVANSTPDVCNLVHLAALLLSEHPSSTLKPTQKFLTSCLNIFSGRSDFTSGPLLLRLQVLRLVRQQCSDRPASLRTLDIGNIWSLFSKFLTKSKQHDDQTSTTIFHEIIMSIGALIRLRRDLVALTLPNLGIVLQQLLATIRRPRPQLGVKQTMLVTDSLPRWINCECPVGPEEVKALARLLETLVTKTTIRTNSSSAEVQRAESLARPFSKHAAYAIKAYIDAMNDPLCILPSELRKELRPGLFALCNMLNDHSRDAMMVSALDAGGKTIMKNLWTEFEKQKYVGKG
ncbi:Urb2/Npa2 family-domain-containing protein [Mycena crocata]|nr:Urb2/Npa2 family-domain-containing protein [Mycena crocata]